jgi:hypothetical protein
MLPLINLRPSHALDSFFLAYLGTPHLKKAHPAVVHTDAMADGAAANKARRGGRLTAWSSLRASSASCKRQPDGGPGDLPSIWALAACRMEEGKRRRQRRARGWQEASPSCISASGCRSHRCKGWRCGWWRRVTLGGAAARDGIVGTPGRQPVDS